MTLTQTLCTDAIATRQTLQFNYDDKPRVVEVHAIGKAPKGIVMRGYQVAGESSRPLPCWALFSLDKIEAASLALVPFSEAPRPGYALNDKKMLSIIAQVPL